MPSWKFHTGLDELKNPMPGGAQRDEAGKILTQRREGAKTPNYGSLRENIYTLHRVSGIPLAISQNRSIFFYNLPWRFGAFA